MSDLAAYLDAFAQRPAGGACEPAPVTAWRKRALARFAEIGWPTRREEDWRFTNLRPLEQEIFPPAAIETAPPAVDAATLAPYALDVESVRILVVNGRLAGPLPAIPGALLVATAGMGAGVAEALDLGEALGRQPFAALNAALFVDGFVLKLPPGTVVERPIEIIHWGAAAAPVSIHTRSLVLLGAGSRATIVETFAGRGRYWTNDVTRIELAAGAELCHVRLQEEAAAAIHIAQIRARLAAKARYESFTLTLGGRLARQDVHVGLVGAGASLALDGAYLLRGAQEATMAIVVDHAAPGCSTREVFKGVVDDRAHGVFQGRIEVRREAQKTDAHQLNRNLLLGPRAAVDTKPELEILADDVKCSHGATVGDLDEAALFYLRARGIAEDEARRMLIDAFAGETLDLVGDAAARSHLRRRLDRWLASREG